MKVIIDTNVVVSAVLRDRTPEEIILFVAQNPDFEWVASPEIAAEYTGVLQRQVQPAERDSSEIAGPVRKVDHNCTSARSS